MRGCNSYFIKKKRHLSDGWLQLELQINSIPFKYLSSTLYICNLCLQVLFYKIPYLLRDGWPLLLSWNKETLKYHEINCSLQLNEVNYNEKRFLRNNHFGLQSFLVSFYFTEKLVHLIRWEPRNI